jgi:plastocyanin
MSTTAEPDTSASDDFDEDPPAEPAGSSDILLGAGQSMWLGLITVGTILALVLSIVAIVMSRSEGGSGGGAAAAPTSSLAIGAVDFAFEPDAWTVVADTEADVTLNNDGGVDHNWTVLDLGTTISSEDEYDVGTVVAATEDIVAGESGTVSTTYAPGTYQVICTISGHFNSGMSGTLTAS